MPKRKTSTPRKRTAKKTQKKTPKKTAARKKSAGPKKKTVGRQPICSERTIKQIDPIWCSEKLPAGFGRDYNDRRNYLLWLGWRLGFRRMEDWYKLSYKDAKKQPGSGIVGGPWRASVVAAVKECFPEYDWQEWLFCNVPKGFWMEPENRFRYIDWLGDKLGFREPEDWYKLRTYHLSRYRGATLLTFYKSPADMVKARFPDYPWKEWLFGKVEPGFWESRRNRRRYMKWLAEDLGIRARKDWYRVRMKHIAARRGMTLMAFYGTRKKFFDECCPGVDFEANRTLWDEPDAWEEPE